VIYASWLTLLLMRIVLNRGLFRHSSWLTMFKLADDVVDAQRIESRAIRR
jgi:hypothetical protein